MAKKAAASKPASKPKRVMESGDDAFPLTLYKKVPKSERWPNGYEAKQFAAPEDVAKIDPAVWKASPADLA